MKRRYHEVGREGTTQLFQECGNARGEVLHVDEAPSGETTPLGSRLAIITLDQDGVHYTFEDVVTGPAQVATESYRRGWDETFTSKAN